MEKRDEEDNKGITLRPETILADRKQLIGGQIVSEAKRLQNKGIATGDPNDPLTVWLSFCVSLIQKLDAAETDNEVSTLLQIWNMHLSKQQASWKE